MHSLRGMVKGFGVGLPHATSDQFFQRCKGSVPEKLLPHLESIFSIVQSLTQQIDNYDERIEKIAAGHYPAVQGLKTVPIGGTLTSLTFVLTITDPGRFLKEPGGERLSGPAVSTATRWWAKSAIGNHQRWRRLLTQITGTKCTLSTGNLWSRHGAEAMGLEALPARRIQRQEVGGVAPQALGDW